MPARPRPLSPHLQIYRWQISNTLSIIHRLTGVGLSAGLLALAWWFVSLAGDPSSYARAARFFASWPGFVLLAGWTFAFFFHLLNGIRHLFWDAGYGFEKGQRHASGWFVVFGSGALTAVLWLVMLRGGR